MSCRKEEAGTLSGAVSLFLKVTKSYWKGLFCCYRFPEGVLPRTNNDLEHHFGSVCPWSRNNVAPWSSKNVGPRDTVGGLFKAVFPGLRG